MTLLKDLCSYLDNRINRAVYGPVWSPCVGDGHDDQYSRHFAQTAEGDGRQSHPRVSHDFPRGGLRPGRIHALGPKSQSTRVIISMAIGHEDIKPKKKKVCRRAVIT